MSDAWQLYTSTVLIYAGIYAIGCLGLNLQFGMTGLINFAFIMFVAAGAYTAGVLTLGPSSEGSFQQYIGGANLPFPLPVIAAAIVGAILSLFVGLLTLKRLRRDYEAVVMLVVSLIALNLIRTQAGIFNGSNGLSGIPKPSASALGLSPYGLSYQWVYAGITFSFLLIVYWVVHRITASPQGRVLRAVRENERAASALGKNVAGARLKAFVAGGAIAAVSGALLSQFLSSWGPGNWEITATFLYFAAVIVGGKGSNLGAVIGAVLVPVGFIEVVRFIRLTSPLVDPLRWITIGVLVLLFLWFRPRGILPERPGRFSRKAQKGTTISQPTVTVGE